MKRLGVTILTPPYTCRWDADPLQGHPHSQPTDQLTNKPINKWTDWLANGQTTGWMGGQTNGLRN